MALQITSFIWFRIKSRICSVYLMSIFSILLLCKILIDQTITASNKAREKSFILSIIILSCFSEARKCLLKRFQISNKTNTFAYFGDSKTRDLYDAMRGLFRGRYVRENVQKDLSYNDPAIHLKMVGSMPFIIRIILLFK